MSTDAQQSASDFSPFEQLRFARQVLRSEGEAILALSERLQDEFCEAIEILARCRGNVIVTGMGKAGLIGQKIAATLASTGTGSHFLHPGEAVHGDLGRVHPLDVVLALSFSGQTAEVTRLLTSLSAFGTPVVAITGNAQSQLGRAAHVTLDLGPLQEACPLGLAPSTSTTAMLALGDALALVLSRKQGFRATDFARFHPGGSLGRKLSMVEDIMRPLEECRLAEQTQSVRSVLVHVSRPGRRTGAIMLVDQAGQLTGLFTDSDLARMLEHNQEAALDNPVSQVMTPRPTTVAPGTFLSQATELMGEKKISELPVVNDQLKPLGLIDITDLLAQEAESSHTAKATQSTPSGKLDRWRETTLRFPNS